MIHIVLGTKAQLIKMAPIMAEMKKQGIEYNYIFTGQHQETMDKLLKNFDLKKPDVTLYNGKDITGVGQMGLWSLRILFKTLTKKKAIFKGDKNGIVLVHGDTFSTLLGALMGRFAGLKVGHVESGLRSFNLFNPFPEELTRVLTFRLSSHYYCAGKWALGNVKKHRGKKINTVENTLLDSLKLAVENQKKIKVDIPKEKYGVVTVHRYENIFNRKQFEKIIQIIEETSKKIKLLFILHPPTRKRLEEFGFMERLKKNKGIELRPRYDYFEFVKLISKAEFVFSDGGSNQEECYYLGKPCLLLRNETERKEGLGKNVVLSKFNEKAITDFVKNYRKCKFPMVKNKMSPSEMIVKSVRGFR
ncbi:MAG: UDP-N-acetylglucosamine 2-epimerase (non-hydrolyzing) [Nanoarchaeota archaeon]|nr:UDP-N-acetylglucosamine 2-epimerase (non-hydrolyzing) [Nanoarchaeota archaeon]